MKNFFLAAFILGATFTSTKPADAFEIAFTWQGLKSCTNGNPNRVDNPEFKLSDVPAGTKFIRFKLVDRNVPGFNHGGGTIAWDGKPVVARGNFKYASPCPPGGSHVYEWTATALSQKNSGKLGEAKARRKYPE